MATDLLAPATTSDLRKRRLLIRYAEATLSVAVAAALRFLLTPLVGVHLPFVTFLVAVTYSAWRGGLGPALYAIIVGGLAAAYLFVPPRGELSVRGAEYALSLIVYVIAALGLAAIGEGLRVTRRRAQTSADALSRHSAVLEQELQQRRHAEEALRQHQLRLQAVLNAIQDGVILAGPNGRVASMNPLGEELTGWPLAEATEKRLVEVARLLDADTRADVEIRSADGRPNPALLDGVRVFVVNRSGGESLSVARLALIHDERDQVDSFVLALHPLGAAGAGDKKTGQ